MIEGYANTNNTALIKWVFRTAKCNPNQCMVHVKWIKRGEGSFWTNMVLKGCNRQDSWTIYKQMSTGVSCSLSKLYLFEISPLSTISSNERTNVFSERYTKSWKKIRSTYRSSSFMEKKKNSRSLSFSSWIA